MNIASERILSLAQDKGIKDQELCRLINAKKDKIYTWKSGRSNPTIDEIRFFSDYFSVATDYILGLTDDSSLVRKEKANPQSELTDVESKLINSFRAVKSEKIRQAVIDILEDSANPATTGIELNSSIQKKYKGNKE